MSVEIGSLGWTGQTDYLTQLRALMALVDRAMGDEGIPARTRDRVVARVLHGTPTPDATPSDWAEPLPRDLAVIDMLADAAPACMRARPTWDMPATTNACDT